MKYTHLNENERFAIDLYFNYENKSITQIARILNRNKSTISRELKRNLNKFGKYNYKISHYKYRYRLEYKFYFSFLKYDEFSKLFKSKFDKNFMELKQHIKI
ncbi:helix-turn-helix domain-containing protein [Ureaplasma urealyticum]|uniref:helix-turn-helix domain-containing protein n=1 Tax=Ureaplasma urealyticum TaxID=2130 RepID=UPI000474F755|nr:helix-turn-helix domain-containing protein [Ureaplasma urealyticum]